ncbi:phage virion morphogenesis protein [Candidatus Magnetoovum chiemensis]|nr:phage virion morphogenesis protein [Candidatus Magnetoovum chiemensis]
MSGALIEITIEDAGVKEMLEAISRRVSDLKPAMEIIGAVVRRSVQNNFRAGGRPKSWKPSLRAKRTGKRTLIDTQRLFNSITYRAAKSQVEIGANVKYAAAHQFGSNESALVRQHSRKVKSRDIKEGGRKTLSGIGIVKAHLRKMNIPARPFLLVQEEDWEEITKALKSFISEG